MSTFEMTESLLEDPDTRVPAAMRMLELLLEEFQSYAASDAKKVLTSIARRFASPPLSLVSSILELIEIYQSCEEVDMVLVVVDVLPQLLREGSSEIVRNCVENLQQLLSHDRTYLVPVIGTIASMPLSQQDEEALFVMTKNALDVVDENDVPSVIRALVRSMSRGGRHSDEIVSLIRKQSESPTLSTSTRTLMYSIVAETIHMNYHAMVSFFKIIDGTCKNKLIFLDAVVLLSLFSKRKTKQMAIKSVQASAQHIRENGRVFVRLASNLPLLNQSSETSSTTTQTTTIQNTLELLRVLLQTTPNLSRPLQLHLRVVLIEAYSTLFSHQVRSRSEILAEMLRFVCVTRVEKTQSAYAGARRWERMRSHLSATASRIGSAVLFRLVSVHPTLVAEYVSHIDDALERIVETSTCLCASSVMAIHRLCIVRTAVAREKKCASQLLIGIQKRMFFGNGNIATPRRETAFIMASHLLRSAALAHEEQDSLLSWVFSAVPKRNEDANKTTIVVFDTLTNASAQFSRRLRLEFLRRYLNLLIRSIVDLEQDKKSSENVFLLRPFRNDRSPASNRIVVNVNRAVSKKMNPRYVAALFRCYLTHRNYSLLRDLPDVAYCVSAALFRVLTTGMVDVSNVAVSEVKMLSALASAVSICACDHVSTTTTQDTVSFEIAHAWLAFETSSLSASLEKQVEEKLIVPISPQTLVRSITCLPMANVSSQNQDCHVPTLRLRITLMSHLSALLGIVNSTDRILNFGVYCCSQESATSSRVVTAREAVHIPEHDSIEIPSFPQWLSVVKSLAVEMRNTLKSTSSDIQERRSYMCLITSMLLFLFRWFLEEHAGIHLAADRQALISSACFKRM